MIGRSLGAVLLVSTALAGCADAAAPAEKTKATPSASAGAKTDDDGDDGFEVLNGCERAAYEERSADDAERTIKFEGVSYTPPCLAIAAGQSVRFEGAFSGHPLAPGNREHADAGSPDSPITATDAGSSLEVTFEKAGIFPYFCTMHGFGAGQGMSGAVWVEP